jgi:general secretion pathway protein D
MNKIKNGKNYSILLVTLCIFIVPLTYCHNDTNEEKEIPVSEKETPIITFNYDNEDVTNIINYLAAFKDVNVIFPPGEAINTKLTLHLDEKMTISESWDLLTTILDVAGFAMVPKEKTIRIIKNPSKEISREPMPTYIGVNPNQLPNTDQYIRYLCYLANIRVSDAPENELNGILRDLLPESALIKADTTTNGLLLVAKANDIRAAMEIISELDKVGFQEKVDILPLIHTSAGIVAQLLNEQLLKVEGTNPYRLDTKKPKEVPYFSGFTKIIPEERLNKLILLGRTQSVERLKDFIKTYIDIAPDSGESILHIHQLQYLDAAQLVPVLNNIIQGSRAGGPSQARGGEKTVGGIERFFDEVIIYADRPAESEELKYYGGNKLVVAARNDDWRQIKKLIEELDTPQKQVLLEVLIVDLTVDDSRQLGSMLRTPDKVPLPDDIGFQSAQLQPPIPDMLPNPTTLDSNLLSDAYQPDVSPTTLANPMPVAGNPTVANLAPIGATMLSLNDNDGQTWSILQLLQACTNSNILSHPHVVATNNKEATVTIGEQRVIQDAASGSLGGSTVIAFKPINADLKVRITPRISAANTINLQVLIDINEFIGGATAGNAQTIRKLETNANIKNGGIFALGGLIKTTTTTSIGETPFFGKIPILGWFFKKRSTEIIKNNLSVFICPTIIEPRLRGGINEFSQRYINIAKDYAGEDLFGSLREPITRWFFASKIDSIDEINDFIAIDEKLNTKQDTIKKEYEDLYTINDPITPQQQPSIVVTDNSSHRLNDLKESIKNDPNPFLKV